MSLSPELIRRLLCPPPLVEHADAGAWWSAYQARSAGLTRSIDRAFLSGLDADRLAWPFAGGYSAALSALVPDLEDSTLAAFAVTEAGGNHPKAIETTLTTDGERARINGHKRWVTLGPKGGTFLVVAKTPATEARPALKVVKVGSDAPGVRLVPLSDLPFVPEIPHAELILEEVVVDRSAILPGDGYDLYVKPFRTVEDLHVHAAVGGFLLAQSVRHSWSESWRERLLSVLLAVDALSALDPRAPEAHLGLAGALAIFGGLIGECDGWWIGDDLVRWQRDRALFKVASGARSKRRERAWQLLNHLTRLDVSYGEPR